MPMTIKPVSLRKRKKFSIFTPATTVIAVQEAGNRVGGHGRDGPHKKSQQKVFQPPKRNIDPAPKTEIAAEDLLAEKAQVFRDRAHRAKPTTECFAKKERHGKKGHEKKHRRRMYR